MKAFKAVLVSLTFVLFFSNFSMGQGIARTHLPDLIVTNIKLVPVPFYKRTYSGNKIKLQVEVTIRNIGRKSIASRNRFDFLLQTPFDNEFGSVYGGLRIGQSKTVRTYITVRSSDMNRLVKFTATADLDRTTDDVYSGHIRESNERNNSRSVSLRIPRYTKKPSHGGTGVFTRG